MDPKNTPLHGLLATAPEVAGQSGGAIKRALQAVRSHLGMDVAYVSEFVDVEITAARPAFERRRAVAHEAFAIT